MFEVTGKYTKAKVMIDDIEKTAITQIVSFLNHQAFTNPVSIMPDCHAGAGAVIGFTMHLSNKIIPNVIGVDIGCGVLAQRLPVKDIGDREQLDYFIREKIPFGYEVHKEPLIDMEKEFPWYDVRQTAKSFWAEFNRLFSANVEPIFYNYDWFVSKCNAIGSDVGRAVRSLGTLGGGNHFVEFGTDSGGSIWLTVHSGSRNLGKKVCEYWQNTPTRKMNEKKQEQFEAGLAEIKRTHVTKAQRQSIPTAIKKLRSYLGMNNKMAKGLEYLEGNDAHGYLHDMIFTTAYAEENRRLMNKIIADHIMGPSDLRKPVYEIESVHNYIDFSDFIIRKGAISAHKDQLIVIPLNMEDGILICAGKGNKEWNYSGPHGAGRLFSRSKAKEKFSSEVVAKRMSEKGIFTSTVPVDEVREAYKDSKIIEEAILPTAEIVDRIKPIMNLKAGDK